MLFFPQNIKLNFSFATVPNAASHPTMLPPLISDKILSTECLVITKNRKLCPLTQDFTLNYPYICDNRGITQKL